MKKKIASSGLTVLFIAACWMAYSFSYIGRLNFSASMADMTSSGVLLKSQAGAVTTGFFICYGCGQLLSGMLGDRINPRYLVFAGLVCSSLIRFSSFLFDIMFCGYPLRRGTRVHLCTCALCRLSVCCFVSIVFLCSLCRGGSVSCV